MTRVGLQRHTINKLTRVQGMRLIRDAPRDAFCRRRFVHVSVIPSRRGTRCFAGEELIGNRENAVRISSKNKILLQFQE
jgi:hypothetical protein